MENSLSDSWCSLGLLENGLSDSWCFSGRPVVQATRGVEPYTGNPTHSPAHRRDAVGVFAFGERKSHSLPPFDNTQTLIAQGLLSIFPLSTLQNVAYRNQTHIRESHPRSPAIKRAGYLGAFLSSSAPKTCLASCRSESFALVDLCTPSRSFLALLVSAAILRRSRTRSRSPEGRPARISPTRSSSSSAFAILSRAVISTMPRISRYVPLQPR